MRDNIVHSLAIENPYLRDCKAKVVQCCDRAVRLEPTIFFPNTSGQPCDNGIIYDPSTGQEHRVTKVILHETGQWHFTNNAPPSLGAIVLCHLDRHRRFFFMRSHTAAVLVSGIACKKWGVTVSSCDMSSSRVRLDFTGGRKSKADVETLINQANEYIGMKLPVKHIKIDRASINDDSFFRSLRSKTKEMGSTLRIVSIELDDEILEAQCDIGTHVRNLSELGTLRLGRTDSSLSRDICEVKGPENFRIRFHLNELPAYW